MSRVTGAVTTFVVVVGDGTCVGGGTGLGMDGASSSGTLAMAGYEHIYTRMYHRRRSFATIFLIYILSVAC
jgi:hypothetical protein